MSRRTTGSFFMQFVATIATFGMAIMPLVGLAQALPAFDYNYIISDSELTDYQSMTQAQIQDFLVSKSSPLVNYLDPITRLAAAQVVYNSAQDFQINPKFLLALMQKEQSLIEDATPQASQFDWATGYAVCDGCDTNDPAIQKFRGFYNQVYNAAKRIRTFYLPALDLQGVTPSGFGPGLTAVVDGMPVTPVNRATAILFTYTPHLHGNFIFGQVWQRYFARAYPDGALLQVEGTEDVWRIQDGARRKFTNASVLLSYVNDTDHIIKINQAELTKYPEGSSIRFPNYAFLRVPRGTVYLVVDDTLRGFASREALRKVGINPGEITPVATEDIASYQVGPPITEQSLYPLGTLMQDKATGGVFWVQEGVKHPIWSREILRVNFGKRHVTKVSQKDLSQFTDGDPVLFREGQLVRGTSDTTVYLISDGLRRPFVSEAIFTALGFEFKNVVVTSDAAVAAHGLGEPIAQLSATN